MKPIVKITAAFITAMILCQLAFMCFTKYIARYENHDSERLQELLYNTTNYDVVFLGSSRTHLGINPKIIDSVCSLNSYNAGIEGAALYEFNMMLDAYLENHPSPKFLVLTLDLHSFSPEIFLFNYRHYFPYTKNTVVSRYLDRLGYMTNAKKLLPYLQITDYDDNSKGFFFKGLLGKKEIPANEFQYKGYLSNSDNKIVGDGPALGKTTYPIADTAKGFLDNIITTCKKHNIKLIFTYAPEYKHKLQEYVSNSNKVLTLIDAVARKENIPFLRDDSLSICTSPDLFANIGHLNKQGGQVYSLLLAKELNTIFSHP